LPLTITQILSWADAFKARHGRWPRAREGPIDGTLETWTAIDQALRKGFRGLPGGSSTQKLLAEYRGVRNMHNLPALRIEQILAWADAFHERTGEWPHRDDGVIAGAPFGETWKSVDIALIAGSRSLPGESSLPKLLSERRGARNIAALPPFSLEQILTWVDDHHRRTGQWPKATDGPIGGANGETWSAVDAALFSGYRGLTGQSSLMKLLSAQRGVRDPKRLPPLTLAEILAWADAHYARTGQWPMAKSGAIAEAPGETWLTVDSTLRRGSRGLPGGSSLFRLLAKTKRARHRGRASAAS
jgi:hypothetical protein